MATRLLDYWELNLAAAYLKNSLKKNQVLYYKWKITYTEKKSNESNRLKLILSHNSCFTFKLHHILLFQEGRSSFLKLFISFDLFDWFLIP